MAVELARVFSAPVAADLEIDGLPGALPTRIEAVRRDVLVVGTPARRREYLALEPGRRVVLAVPRRSTRYLCQTRVVGTEWSDGASMTLLRRPADEDWVAPRCDVRVPVAISDGQFWWEDETGKFGPFLAGSLIDLSVGGFQAMTRAALPVGTRVLARFTMSCQVGHLMADAVVLRSYSRVSDAGVRTHRSHCQFVDLPKRDRDRLLRFVFQRERELRQRGVF
ncbi:MAG TPA: PilZ domain-containing protein [Chloroflexota bacterium]|jgi:c-di-GMP-binding flagellar brake protein YcgR|nr:PilZ domain-containing protein [Chloroflexota bacterium]